MTKSTTAERLYLIMCERGLRQVDILRACQPYCKKYGVKLGKNDLSQYISGKVKPGQDKLSILGLALDVSEAWLIGYDVPRERSYTFNKDNLPDNIIPVPKSKKIPLLGTIACGEPILANENIEDYVPMPDFVNCTFALKCKGDSMVGARIFDGDIVYIKEQPEVENGEIAAVLIGDEATLKRFYKYGDTVVLRAENPNFPELTYKGEEINNIRILGKAVYFLSAVK